MHIYAKYRGKARQDGGIRASIASTLAETPATAFSPLLEYLYEGRCSCEEGLLMPLLHAANYLGVKPLELSIGIALQARLHPSNAFDLWTLAEEFMLALRTEAAKSFLPSSNFEELVKTSVHSDTTS